MPEGLCQSSLADAIDVIGEADYKEADSKANRKGDGVDISCR